jgi:hypothetical protein
MMKIDEMARHILSDATDDYLIDVLLPDLLEALEARGYIHSQVRVSRPPEQ